MNKNFHNLIKAEYDRRQKHAWEELNRKVNEVYANVPRIIEIDKKIRNLGVKNSRGILSDTHAFVHSDWITEIDKLRYEKIKLLKEAGYTDNHMEVIYQCSVCKDTGIINSETGSELCNCYKQMLMEFMYNQFNLKLIQFENFESFDEYLYSDYINEELYGVCISPKENIMSIKKRAVKFIQNFADNGQKNLFFSGATGVGKTFMSNCIAKEILDAGWTVLYITSPMLFNLISEYRARPFKNANSYSNSDNQIDYNTILSVDLLIIDDLGTESMSASRYSEFLTILDVRRVNNLTNSPCKTIISTNLSLKEVKESYTERVLSRIVQLFDMILFWGQDLRKKKKI